jgi:hypothetical protein
MPDPFTCAWFSFFIEMGRLSPLSFPHIPCRWCNIVSLETMLLALCHRPHTSFFEFVVLCHDFSLGEQSECLDQAIRSLRDALNACPPSIYHPSLELANFLVVRFLTLQIDDDYREAEAVLHNITHPPPPRASSDPYQIQASALTTALRQARSVVYSNRENWEGGSIPLPFLP